MLIHFINVSFVYNYLYVNMIHNKSKIKLNILRNINYCNIYDVLYTFARHMIYTKILF